MTEITGVVVNQNVNIPTYTNVANLPTDGSVLLAHFEPPQKFAESFGTLNPDRILLYFSGGINQEAIPLGDGSQVITLPGWVIAAS